MTSSRPLKVLIVVIIAAFSEGIFASPNLTFSNARVMLTPPGVSVTAGLVTIYNPSDQEITILHVEAQYFESVQIHKTQISDGMARMIEQEKISVAPLSTLHFEHGSYHMMLYAPTRGFIEDDTIKITFTTNIGKIQFDAVVKKLSQ
jgi:copper(I)-binding protein